MPFKVRATNSAPMFPAETGQLPEGTTGPWVIVDTTIMLHPPAPAAPRITEARIEA